MFTRVTNNRSWNNLNARFSHPINVFIPIEILEYLPTVFRRISQCKSLQYICICFMITRETIHRHWVSLLVFHFPETFPFFSQTPLHFLSHVVPFVSQTPIHFFYTHLLVSFPNTSLFHFQTPL